MLWICSRSEGAERSPLAPPVTGDLASVSRVSSPSTRAALDVGTGYGFILESVPRAAAAGTLGAAALDHEVLDDPVEGAILVETLPGQEDEVVDGAGRFIGE